jgi:hypothetical protein
MLADNPDGGLLLEINGAPFNYFGDNSFISKFLSGDDYWLNLAYEEYRDNGNPDVLYEEFIDALFAASRVDLRLIYVKRVGDSADSELLINQGGVSEDMVIIPENFFSQGTTEQSVPVIKKFFSFERPSGMYRCYELAKASGTYQEILGQSLTEFAKVCLEQLEEQYDVAGNSAYDILENAVTRKLLEQMRDSDKFEVMFDYCFNMGDISSLAAAHVSQSNMTEDLLRMFNSTKERIRIYLNNLNEFGTDMTRDVSDCLPKAANGAGMGNFNADMEFSSELLLILLSTPLYIYKGWVKVADPHCLITQTIVDLAETGFLIPKLKDFKVYNPLSLVTDAAPCDTITLPWFPGDPLGFFGLTQIVATGVTFAPMIVGLPPFPPTPFGLVYYTVVEPLLYLLEMDWRNKKMMENPDYKNAIVVQTGISMEDVPVCFEDQQLLIGAQDEETQAIAEASENLDEDNPCPTLDIEFYKGDNC